MIVRYIFEVHFFTTALFLTCRRVTVLAISINVHSPLFAVSSAQYWFERCDMLFQIKLMISVNESF